MRAVSACPKRCKLAHAHRREHSWCYDRLKLAQLLGQLIGVSLTWKKEVASDIGGPSSFSQCVEKTKSEIACSPTASSMPPCTRVTESFCGAIS